MRNEFTDGEGDRTVVYGVSRAEWESLSSERGEDGRERAREI